MGNLQNAGSPDIIRHKKKMPAQASANPKGGCQAGGCRLALIMKKFIKKVKSLSAALSLLCIIEVY